MQQHQKRKMLVLMTQITQEPDVGWLQKVACNATHVVDDTVMKKKEAKKVMPRARLELATFGLLNMTWAIQRDYETNALPTEPPRRYKRLWTKLTHCKLRMLLQFIHVTLPPDCAGMHFFFFALQQANIKTVHRASFYFYFYVCVF